MLWPAVGPLHLPLTPLIGWPPAPAIVAGSAMALAQTDLKRLLAYSSVSHVGYLALGMALGNRDGLLGTMLHIVGHGLSKGCLFLIAGGVAYRHGGRSMAGVARARRAACRAPWRRSRSRRCR